MPRGTSHRGRSDGDDGISGGRALLLARRERYDDAMREFRWPALDAFNWALDWFDAYARGNDRAGALDRRDDGGDDAVLSFAELAARSQPGRQRLRALGVRRGDRVLLMLPNVVAALGDHARARSSWASWSVPATTQLGADRPAPTASRAAASATS